MERVIKNIIDRYTADLAEYKRQREEIQRKTEELNRQSELIKCPSWVDDIVKPIAERMTKEMPDRTYDILGPFGMGSRTSIHFYKKGIEEKDKFKGDNCLSITFEPGDLERGEIKLVDYTVNLHRFAEGTIGEMNGFNYPIVAMKNTIKELVDFMKEQDEKTSRAG